MAALNAEGEILYWGGNTGIHILDLSFIKRLNSHGFALPYHRALRPVDIFSPTGRSARIEGWKFETFVFDAIPLAGKTCCMEVRREEEFSPVKSSDGPDSPRTARAAMSNLFRQWLAEAGITAATDLPVEVSPLFATDKETFVRKLKGKAHSGDGCRYFEEQGD
jgi:UDP-N-acetylglucosamine/UDP-N-acetylgalactosamine diphosphorylase